MLDDTERQGLLENERFLTELVATRNLTYSKPWWESQGLWATIGALVVGLTTILGNYLIQDKQKTREVTLARLDFELKQNRSFLDGTTRLIGRVLSAADDMLWLADGNLDKSKGEHKKLVDSINAADREWRDGQVAISFLFSLYYGDNETLPAAWKVARDAVKDAWSCSEHVYMKNYSKTIKTKAPPDGCSAKLVAAEAKWQALALPLAKDYPRRLARIP
jgi:hypothetical protein